MRLQIARKNPIRLSSLTHSQTGSFKFVLFGKFLSIQHFYVPSLKIACPYINIMRYAKIFQHTRAICNSHDQIDLFFYFNESQKLCNFARKRI